MLREFVGVLITQKQKPAQLNTSSAQDLTISFLFLFCSIRKYFLEFSVRHLTVTTRQG